MNSRERILAAMDHRQPDMVPIDFGAHRSSGISAIAYSNLKKAMGITSGDIYVYDMVQQLAIVEPEILDAFGVDAIELGRGFMLDDSEWKDWQLPDGTPCKIPAFINLKEQNGDTFLLADDGRELGMQEKGCLYFTQTYWPWADRDMADQDFSDLEETFGQCMWTAVATPSGNIPLTEDGLKELANGAKVLRESTDRAIVGLFGGNLFEVPQYFYRNDNYMMNMGLHPDKCVELSEALCDFYMPRLEKWLTALAPYIDVILFGDDLGGQNGPLMSLAMFRNYYKPWYTKMWKRVKEIAPNVRIHLHSCGGIEPLLDDLIDAGLEMANPVQISCAGMDAKKLKENYGDRFTFWGGGCDTREMLPRATPEEIKHHVKEQVSILNVGGGFVFQQVHNIMANVPPENIIAMFESVRS